MNRIEINKRIDYITKKLEKLSLSIKKFESSSDENDKYIALKAIERDCEEIVESAVRVNQEILTNSGEIGETYRDSFEKLKSLKIFTSKELLEKLANTTGFRNRLAHDYIDIDDDITIVSAKNILEIYPKYLTKISDYLDNK